MMGGRWVAEELERGNAERPPNVIVDPDGEKPLPSWWITAGRPTGHSRSRPKHGREGPRARGTSGAAGTTPPRGEANPLATACPPGVREPAGERHGTAGEQEG